MKAVVIDDKTPDRALVYAEVDAPRAADPFDLLVRVRAIGVNRADLRRSSQHFAASESRQMGIAGVELAGEIVSVGSAVTAFRPGDRVMAMAGGAYAEEAVVDARLAIPVPRSFTWDEAAATSVSFVTAYDALSAAAEMKAGDDVLVQGASSTAGIATVQVARWMGAKQIFGIAGSPEKLERLKQIGCDTVLNYRTEDIVAAVRKGTDGSGATVVIDIVGGPMAQVNIDASAVKARIVCLGRVAGEQASINLDEFSRKRLHMIGVTFRTRSLAERMAVISNFRGSVLPALEQGLLRPIVDKVFKLSDASAAQAYIRENRHFGKVILQP